MFNKTFNVVAAECAVLNAKLRFHKAGRLNTERCGVAPKAFVYAEQKHGYNYLKAIIAVISVALSLILIGRLFSK